MTDIPMGQMGVQWVRAVRIAPLCLCGWCQGSLHDIWKMVPQEAPR